MKRILFVLLALVLGCNGVRTQTVIQMEEYGGVYRIPCKVNGAKMKLIFDTGAEKVCLSLSMANYLYDNDYITDNDIVGSGTSTVADGSIVDHIKIIIRDIEIEGIHLRNVEAIVIDGQNAPLLLGQSAIKKLGSVTITGNRLIIDSGSTSDYSYKNRNNNVRLLYDELIQEYDLGSYEQFAADVKDDVKRRKLYDAIINDYDLPNFEEFTQYLLGKKLSEAEIDQLFTEASEAYDDGAYSVALEKYELLLDNHVLSAYGVMSLADCYYSLDKKDDALQTYLLIKDDIEVNFPQHKISLYSRIGKCYYSLGNSNDAIIYFEKVKLFAQKWSEEQSAAVYFLSTIYNENENAYKARKVIDDYIYQYLAFMEIKATDCWTKLYRDDFLADLYVQRIFLSLDSDMEKYYVISAAWGSKEAQEFCKKYGYDYSTKPSRYEY